VTVSPTVARRSSGRRARRPQRVFGVCQEPWKPRRNARQPKIGGTVRPPETSGCGGSPGVGGKGVDAGVRRFADGAGCASPSGTGVAVGWGMARSSVGVVAQISLSAIAQYAMLDSGADPGESIG